TDRDFYQVLKSNPALTTFMGHPVSNRATGSWTIHLVRKVADANGEFLGLVLGAMEMAYFDQYFATIVLGGESAIKLLRDDGMLLASHPQVNPAKGRAGLRNDALLDILARTKDGPVRELADIDGTKQIVVAARLGHYPFVITATKTLTAAIA